MNISTQYIKEIIALIEDNFTKGIKNSYELGKKVGANITRAEVLKIQNATNLISPHAKVKLIDLFFPELDEDDERYKELERMIFSDFISGVIKSSISSLTK